MPVTLLPDKLIPLSIILNVLPFKVNVLSSAINAPALENCVKEIAVVSNVMLSVIHTKPLSALVVPSSTNTKALFSSAAVLASSTLVGAPVAFTL